MRSNHPRRQDSVSVAQEAAGTVERQAGNRKTEEETT